MIAVVVWTTPWRTALMLKTQLARMATYFGIGWVTRFETNRDDDPALWPWHTLSRVAT